MSEAIEKLAYELSECVDVDNGYPWCPVTAGHITPCEGCEIHDDTSMAGVADTTACWITWAHGQQPDPSAIRQNREARDEIDLAH